MNRTWFLCPVSLQRIGVPVDALWLVYGRLYRMHDVVMLWLLEGPINVIRRIIDKRMQESLPTQESRR